MHFWPPQPTPTPPAPGVVQVWQIAVEDWMPQLEALRACLAPAERHRVDRYRFARHRDRAAVIGGVLRRVLGSALGADPAALRLAAAAYGKPYLLMPDGQPAGLRFNVSDSAGVALIAVGWDTEIGVDVERIRPAPYRALASRFFAREEADDLLSLDDEDLPEAFFACWTRKEAYLKCMGTGLRTPLQSFAVSVRTQDPVRLRRPERPEHAGWYLGDLAPGNGYAAALATATVPQRITTATLVPHPLGP